MIEISTAVALVLAISVALSYRASARKQEERASVWQRLHSEIHSENYKNILAKQNAEHALLLAKEDLKRAGHCVSELREVNGKFEATYKRHDKTISDLNIALSEAKAENVKLREDGEAIAKANIEIYQEQEKRKVKYDDIRLLYESSKVNNQTNLERLTASEEDRDRLKKLYIDMRDEYLVLDKKVVTGDVELAHVKAKLAKTEDALSASHKSWMESFDTCTKLREDLRINVKELVTVRAEFNKLKTSDAEFNKVYEVLSHDYNEAVFTSETQANELRELDQQLIQANRHVAEFENKCNELSGVISDRDVQLTIVLDENYKLQHDLEDIRMDRSQREDNVRDQIQIARAELDQALDSFKYLADLIDKKEAV